MNKNWRNLGQRCHCFSNSQPCGPSEQLGTNTSAVAARLLGIKPGAPPRGQHGTWPLSAAQGPQSVGLITMPE